MGHTAAHVIFEMPSPSSLTVLLEPWQNLVFYVFSKEGPHPHRNLNHRNRNTVPYLAFFFPHCVLPFYIHCVPRSCDERGYTFLNTFFRILSIGVPVRRGGPSMMGPHNPVQPTMVPGSKVVQRCQVVPKRQVRCQVVPR